MKQLIFSKHAGGWKKIHTSRWLWTGKLWVLWQLLLKKIRG